MSAEERAMVTKQNRNERDGSKTPLLSFFSIFPTLPCSFHPVASLSLCLSLPHHLSPQPPHLSMIHPALSSSPSLSIHTAISPWFPERGVIAAAGIQTSWLNTYTYTCTHTHTQSLHEQGVCSVLVWRDGGRDAVGLEENEGGEEKCNGRGNLEEKRKYNALLESLGWNWLELWHSSNSKICVSKH